MSDAQGGAPRHTNWPQSPPGVVELVDEGRQLAVVVEHFAQVCFDPLAFRSPGAFGHQPPDAAGAKGPHMAARDIGQDRWPPDEFIPPQVLQPGPLLYNRDRPLFRKYVPLCKLVAEAGWEPVTLARSSDPKVLIERFGEKYLTVFNDADDARTVTVSLDGLSARAAKELVDGVTIPVHNGAMQIALGPADVAVLELVR